MEFLVGKSLKFQRGQGHWEYKIKAIVDGQARVQIVTKDGRSGASTMTIEYWDESQLKARGFQMEETDERG